MGGVIDRIIWNITKANSADVWIVVILILFFVVIGCIVLDIYSRRF